MGNIGPGELLIIGLIALLLFGAGRIADIGKGLGQGISNFKKGLREADDEEAKPAKKSEKSEKAEKNEKAAKDDEKEAEEKPAKA